MLKFTKVQTERIRNSYCQLCTLIGNDVVSVERTALLLMELCPNLEYESLLFICSRMQKGMDEFERICEEEKSLTEPDLIRNILKQATAEMTQLQRKGFFLQCFEAIRIRDADDTLEEAALVNLPDLAVLEEEELQALVLEQIRYLSKSMTLEMAESLSGILHTTEQADSEVPKEVLLLAAAEFAAGVNGDLTLDFQEYPELLGACAAADFMLCEYSIDYMDSSMEAIEIISGIFSALVGVALMLVADNIASVAADAIFTALESGTLAYVITCFTTFGMAIVGAVAGIAAFIGIMAVMDENVFSKTSVRTFYRQIMQNTKIPSIDSNEQEEETVVFVQT